MKNKWKNTKLATADDFRRLPESKKKDDKTYSALVERLVREKYTQSAVEAIVNNYLDDSENEAYKAEFVALQMYRKECKARAKALLGRV